MLALDYRACGKHGEPTVVHVDQKLDFAITWVAENFEAFVTGLVDESVYDTSEQDRLDALATARQGSCTTACSGCTPASTGSTPSSSTSGPLRSTSGSRRNRTTSS